MGDNYIEELCYKSTLNVWGPMCPLFLATKNDNGFTKHERIDKFPSDLHLSIMEFS